METISVDVGYSYTKTHRMLIFPSRIQKGGDILRGSEAIYKGEKYGVGFGRNEVELNKVNSDVTKICLLYALCRSTTDNDIKLITGLPIGQYMSQKQKLIASFSKDTDITVSGIHRPLKIHDVQVFPQGAGALYSSNIEGDCILVDIGGRTIDIALFVIDGKRRLANYSTLYSGTITLYSKIIKEINGRFDLALNVDDGERILKNGLKINGKEQDINFVKDIVYDHATELKNELKVNYPSDTTKIYLCGGGAYLYSKLLKHEMLDNSQFANAIGFYRMGVN